tara:strand:- start:1410 stop:2441 length:1032 start_codon:yes stop_codon:yes gene_type:complete
MDKLVFSIETSCDETSVAILNNKRKILSHITVNQQNHNKFGGVVPEIASRAHLEILQNIIPKSLKEAGISINDIDLFCATCGPGLIGCLLVGSTISKSMAVGTNKPFYPINHLEGHLLSTEFSSEMKFPNLSMLLTGGHTQIYLIKSVGNYELLGDSLDDAIGESFDKVAKLIGLGYPGGPLIEKLAMKGEVNAFKLPHPLEFKRNLNFSFSGIKTAVNLLIKKQKKINNEIKQNISASFQNKIIEILIKKLELALDLLKKQNYNINDISIVGGVAANNNIKESLKKLSQSNNCRLIFPPLELCGDNAVMIANVCLQHYKLKKKPNINFIPDSRITLTQKKLL